MAGQGLYGTYQGNETRFAGRGMGDQIRNDHYRDNEIVEGEARAHIADLMKRSIKAAKEGREYHRKLAGEQLECYLDELRSEGYSENRIQAMLGAATRGIRI